ncbi:OmpP1/FadL family transporter [Chryseobacterium sp. T1]
MLKKSLLAVCIPAAFYLQAQDISVIRNTIDVYGGGEINGSAKYNAMAGSMGALGGDVSSINTNPAGLGVNILSDVNVGLGIFSNKNASSLAGSSRDYKTNKTLLNNASAILAFDLRQANSNWKYINLGINYNSQKIDNTIATPGNQNIKGQIDLIDSNNNPLVGNLTYMGHAYERYGDINKTNVAVGANYDNKIFIGAGLNFHDAYIEQYDTASLKLEAGGITNTNNYSKQYTPFSENASGFSANIGIIGKISKEIRLGASIETPTWWRMDRVFTEYYHNKDNNIASDTYTEDRKLRTPTKATLSAAFVPSKSFAINVDYIQGLSKPKYTVYGDAETELNSLFKDVYKNTSEVRVGAEYRLEGLRLRGGYAYATSPFDNMSVPAFSDNGAQNNVSYKNLILGARNTYGLGVGYDFKAFYIDASYQNITSKYNNPFFKGDESNNPNFESTGYYNNLKVISDANIVSNVKTTKSNFFVTLGWKF